MACSSVALAQAVDEAPIQLRRTPQLQENLPADVRKQQPTFIGGDTVKGRTDLETVIEGNAELRRGDTMIRADRLDYAVPDDRVNAVGSVHINQAGNVYEGTALDLQMDAFKGQFDNAKYRFLETGGHGESTRVDFIDRDHAVIHNATYTTCQRDDQASWTPSWQMKAETIEMDMGEEVGVAEAVEADDGLIVAQAPVAHRVHGETGEHGHDDEGQNSQPGRVSQRCRKKVQAQCAEPGAEGSVGEAGQNGRKWLGVGSTTINGGGSAPAQFSESLEEELKDKLAEHL